ncbi:MAG: hypothetical protein HYR85_07570 [Planctomycetes bacterium]|nr:hypothetical protein [Planctomycetota bacterium]
MPKKKHRNDATASLVKLAKYFAEEVESRAWGKAEFDKLVRASAKAREKIDDRERSMARLVLSSLDRVTSLAVASDAITQILEDAEKPIPTRAVLDALSVLRDQARNAIDDSFGAVRAVERSPMRFDRRTQRATISKGATALAAFQPEPADLVSLLAGRRTPVERAIREALVATWFVERAIETVEGMVKKQRSVDPGAVRDLATFLVGAATFARDVITLKVATAIEASGKRKGR